MEPPTHSDSLTDQQPEMTEQDSAAKFAQDLSELRNQAGNPTLMALNRKSDVSRSVLSDAFRGVRLPTPNTTKRLVEALGDDPKPWLERRHALDPRASRQEIAVADDESQHDGDKETRLGKLVFAAAAAALVATLLGNLLWDSVFRGTPADAEAPPNYADDDEFRNAVATAMEDLRDEASAEGREEPETGVDPMNSICHEDSVIAASEERLDGEVQVQLLWSNECNAAWGRITRWDEQSAGNSVRFMVYPQNEGPESDRTQEREAFDVQSVYTTMLIETNTEARICGVAYITREDEDDEIELTPPMCI